MLRHHGTSCRGQSGLVVHTTRREIRALEHKQVSGLRYTDRPTSWVSLAMAGASVYQLIVAGDALMPRQGAKTHIESLRHRTEGFGLFTGLGNARAALKLIRAGTESPMETHLRLLILAAGLPEPTVNLRLRNDHGETLAFLDLAYATFLLALEYDGDEFHSSKAQRRKDANRDRTALTFGYQTLRFNGSILWDPDSAIGDIRRALLSRGWDGRPAPFHHSRAQLAIPVYLTTAPAVSGSIQAE